MSFIAECPFCSSKVRVPEGAAGLSVPCPRCGNSFTLAALRKETAAPVGLKIKAAHKAEAPLSAMTGPLTPAVLAPRARLPRGEAPVPEEYVKQALQTEQLRTGLPAGPAESAGEPRRRRLNPLAVLSFLLGSVALLFAEIPLLSFLALPLAGLGLLLGLAAFVAVPAASRGPWLLPLAGSLLSAAVIGIVCLWPLLLGLEPRAGDEARANDDRQRKLSYGGQTNLGNEVSEQEWIDARKSFLQHGLVRLRLKSATVKRVTYRTSQGSWSSRGKKLVLSISVIQMRPGPRLTYQSWGTAGQDSERTPHLQDSTGKAYPLTTAAAGAEVPGQVGAAITLPPGKFITDVMVFEAPAGRVDFLRLELPASAFGGKGTLRVQIPGSMIDER